MKRILFLVLAISVITSVTLRAQAWKIRRYEGIVGIGTSNYFGDIGGYSKGENILGIKDLSISRTRPSFYLGARYKLYEVLALKLNFTFGFLSGSDANKQNDARNLEFSATIFEPSIQVEYSFLKEKASQSYLMMKGSGVRPFNSNISVYVFLGLGGGFFSPKAKENLENFEFDYSKATLVVPMGLGLKYGLSPKWSIGFDLGGRLTTTDYLDGYTSSYSKSNDVYYFGVINFVYKMRTTRSGWPAFR
ncbi:MAG: outer membrane beta-barrel protein [Bacteroidales bacterium]|nr:MAG: outer membrane beta-barrel protein [Bacteroidales bacterium]